MNALTRAFKLVAEEYGPDIARRIEPYIPDYSTVEEVLDAARNLVGSGKKNVAPAVIKRRSGTPAAEPFAATLEARVRYTADRLGLDPEKVLDMLLKGQIPLLRDGGSVSLESLSARYRD